MFVLSVNRKSFKRYIFAALLAAAVFFAAELFIISSSGKAQTAEFNGKKYSLVFDNEKARRDFLEQLGFDANSDELSKDSVTVPYEFNKTYSKYNELQLMQGLDLSEYKGKTADRYVYEIKEGFTSSVDEAVRNNRYLCVLSADGRVIGGHIGSGLQNDSITTFFGEKLG